MASTSIQWFPGHMHKAHKEIKEVLPQVDIIIEVVDARIPYSSENPLISSIRDNMPCIKVLNKADLANPEMTAVWVDYFEQKKAAVEEMCFPDRTTQIGKMCDLYLRKKSDLNDHLIHILFSSNRWEKECVLIFQFPVFNSFASDSLYSPLSYNKMPSFFISEKKY